MSNSDETTANLQFTQNPRALIITIQGLLPSLPPAERSIAKVLLTLGDVDPTDLRAARIAALAGVSEAAVVKFAQRRLGLSGFRELRVVMLNYQQMSAPVNWKESNNTSESDVLIQQVFQTSIQSLMDTLAIFDSKAFDRAARILAGARHRFLFGMGGSAPLVREFEHRLLDVGMTSSAHDEPQFLPRAVALAGKADAILAVSHSGGTQTVLDALKAARAKGVPTIGLTNARGSALASLSTVALITAAQGSSVIGQRTVSKVVHLNLLYALAVRAAQYAAQASVQDNQVSGQSPDTNR